MTDNTLTTKEWLEKEGFKEIKVVSIEQSIARKIYYKTLEDYANYKNRILEDKINGFREEVLKGKWIKYLQICNEDSLEEWDKYFNIQNNKL